MKEVIVPVDFSDEALNALEYGVAMANHLEANLRVIHIKTGTTIVPVFADNKADYLINRDVNSWAEELHGKFVNKYKVDKGVFDYKIREGDLVEEITNQAKYDDASLIVLGTHTDTSFSARWTGSNAYHLVAHSPCPVLVVNKRMTWKEEVKNIIIPIDDSVSSRKKVSAVAGIAYLFNAKVAVVGLQTSDSKWVVQKMDAYVEQVKRYLIENVGVIVATDEIVSDNLSDSIMEYANNVDADLLTVHIHHSKVPFSKMFQPFTNELINKSLIPVMVIPTND